jgi:membrane protein
MSGDDIKEAIERLRWFGRQIVRQFLELGLMESAGALTYTTLFAVVPLMTVAYTMMSVLPAFSGVGEQVQEFIFRNFVPESSSMVKETLTEFSNQARELTFFGIAFLVVTAFLMLVTIEKAFNVIWHVAEPRRGLQRFLVYWGVLTCGPPLVAGGLLISSYLISAPLVVDIDTFGVRETVLGYLPVVLSATGFTVLYAAVPNCHVPFRHAVLGGLLTMLSFEAAKKLFALIVANSSLTVIYGAFAAVPLFLIWLYLVWVLILAGAIFVRTLSLTREISASDREPLLLKCVRVLSILYSAHMEGRAVTDQEINEAVAMTREQRDAVFEVLGQMKLVTQTEDERLTLGRSLKGVTLWSLYQELPNGVDTGSMRSAADLKPVVERLEAFAKFGVDHLSQTLEELFDRETQEVEAA